MAAASNLRQRLDAKDKAIGVATLVVGEGLNTVRKCSNDEPKAFFNTIGPKCRPAGRLTGVERPSSQPPEMVQLTHNRPRPCSLPRAQKSDVCAVGIAASVPKKCGFSAQTASGQSPMRRL